jgi:2-polyprenyl-3-methyl-5-hydroxy-6-metoxy-1,4-benzoquinol methylase
MTSDSQPNLFAKTGTVRSGELEPTEKVDCPLCHIAPEPFAVDDHGFNLCKCPKCGLQFVNPRLDFEQLADKVYTDVYFPHRADEAELGTAERHLYSLQLANFERLLGRKGRVLDIGCGNGSFLSFAEESGWEIAGVDIKLSSDARRLTCPLWEGRLQDIDFGGERFDCIRLNHVLEHTQNPLEELVVIRGLLHPGGIVYLSVPNIAGISARLKNAQSRLGLKGRPWRHYAAMHHLFFFTPDTLKAVAEGAGLRVLEWETPVLKKEGQGVVLEAIYRLIYEKARTGSILDLYCTPD